VIIAVTEFLCSGRGGHHGTVSPVRLRKGELTVQDGNLMPEHQDLRILTASLRAKGTSQPDTRTMNKWAR
jgi:hypothetical protein